MGVLVLECPTTGREFSTGIPVEEDSLRRLPDTVAEAQCPQCGALQRWRTHEALVDRVVPSQLGMFDKAS